MVFFVCEGCNETLKKNKVDQHAARCRNCWAVSCVDCSVVFEGNDYAAHTSCISEAQKYEKSLYKEKNGKQVKKSPQERWMEVVQTATVENDSKLQNVLDRIAGYDNVPRKKAKFVNFMKNSIGMTDNNTVERVWTIFETAFQATQPDEQPENTNNNKKRTERDESTPVDDKENKKPKTEENDTTEKAIKWSKLIKSALKSSSDKQLDMAALQEQVLQTIKDKKPKTEENDTTEKAIKWSKLIKSALKSSSDKQLDMAALQEQVLQTIKDKKLSSKDDKELKKEFQTAVQESSKVQVVQVVRLA